MTGNGKVPSFLDAKSSYGIMPRQCSGTSADHWGNKLPAVLPVFINKQVI